MSDKKPKEKEESGLKLVVGDNGVVYCFKKIVTPVGRFCFTSVRQTVAGFKEGSQVYKACLEWGNEDEFKSSPAYKPFMDHVKAFAKAAAPKKKKDELTLPISEKLRNAKDPESEMVWRMECNIPSDKQPKLYDFHTNEEFAEDETENCRNGDRGFLKGWLYYTATMTKDNEPRFLIKMRPTSVWHVEHGDFGFEPEELPEEMDHAYFGIEKKEGEAKKKPKKKEAEEADAEDDPTDDWDD